MRKALCLALVLGLGCEGLELLRGDGGEKAVLPYSARAPSPRSPGSVEPECLLEPTSACPHPAGTRVPAPLCETRLLPDGTRVSDVLWPLATARTDRTSSILNVRPLVYTASAPGERDVRVLPPVFRYRRSSAGVSWRLWPLFSVEVANLALGSRTTTGESIFDKVPIGLRYRRYEKGGKPDVDGAVWPLVFWGNDREEGPYFALFPLGGVWKDFLGKKKISFALFPLFVWTEDYHYRTYNFIWPLFGRWEGPDQHGFRAFPFAGENVREGRFERRWWLWPLVHHWWQGLDTKFPTEVSVVWPLWGRIRNANTDHVMVLWPFFSLRRERARRLVEVHAPWPIFSYTKGDGLRTMKVWPLFGYRNSNEYRGRFFLWPFFRWEVQRDPYYLRKSRRILLIWSEWHREWIDVEEKTASGETKRQRVSPAFLRPEDRIPDPRFSPPSPPPEGERKSRSFWKLWPLFHARRDADGSRAFQLLSVWPMLRGQGEIESSWATFVTLYRYERTGNHKRESALFGLYRHLRDERSRTVSVAPVWGYQKRTYQGFKEAKDAAGRRAASARRCTVLGGLFEYERIGKWKAFRFLWIPLGRIPRSVREDAAGL